MKKFSQMAHLRNHLRHAHKIEDGVTLSNAIQSRTNVISQGIETQSYSDNAKIGSVELLPVDPKKKEVSEDASKDANNENDGQESVAVKVEICPQFPMSEIQDEDNNSVEDEGEENGNPGSISTENN